MRCPFCASQDTQVKDSRVAEDGSYIKRRRFCTECGSRFTTFERIQLKDIMVKRREDAPKQALTLYCLQGVKMENICCE